MTASFHILAWRWHSRDLQNTGILPQHHTVSQPGGRRLQFLIHYHLHISFDATQILQLQ